MLLVNYDCCVNSKSLYYKMRPIWSLKSALKWYQSNPNQCFVSYPFLAQTGQVNFNEIQVNGLYIKVKNPSDRDAVNEIMDDLEEAIGRKPRDTWSQAQSLNKFKTIIDLVFSIIIGIMMFLCFFSLSASMTANLYEQSKEIGVLRSMGVTRNRIKLLYFYEALILVFSASMLGILIGTFIGFSLML